MNPKMDISTRAWKLLRAVILFLFGQQTLAVAGPQSLADQQVQAVFGVPPWNELETVPPSITRLASSNCTAGRDFPAGTDLYTASSQCIARYEGSGPWFRSDLGTDSTGSAPPSGMAGHPDLGITVPRCSGFFTPDGTNETVINCTVFTFVHTVPAPVAQDQYVKTAPGVPVTLDLAAGFIGAAPTFTTIENTPVGGKLSAASNTTYVSIGGSVTGLTGTLVTFTPTPGFQGASGFEYALDSPSGTSNVATVSITVATPQFTTNEILEAVQIADACQQPAAAFHWAAMVADPVGAATDAAESAAEGAYFNELFKNDEGSVVEAERFVTAENYVKSILTNAPAKNPIAFTFQALEGAFNACSAIANLIVHDGPDSNYTVVAQPQQVQLPSTGNATVDAVIVDYLAYYSTAAVALQAAERYQGAIVAKQTSWATVQAQAFQQYSGEMTTAKSVLGADNQKLLGVLPTVDISSYPGGAAALLSLYQSQCSTQLLPSYLNLPLLNLANERVALGAQTIVTQAVCDTVGAANVGTVTVDFAQYLSQPFP
jgi:hypothetical protein